MRQALGKGIDALIGTNINYGDSWTNENSTKIIKIEIDRIIPNRLQPRRKFKDEKIKELADSIKEHGLAQPILVSKSSTMDGDYELIAGERRLRASKLAGLKDIDCIVRQEMPNLERLAVALIENLQREDLTPIEEALGYNHLAKDFNLTQEQISQSVGKSRVAISNCLRLLDLKQETQQAISDGVISEGHGRALLMVNDPDKRDRLFHIVTSRHLSVRETEDAARKINDNRDVKKITLKSAETKDLESELQHVFGTKVELRSKNNNSGKLIVHYFSLDDLDRILKIFKK